MINLNLLPEAEKLKHAKARKSANVFSICLVVILITILVSFAIWQYKSLLQTRLDNTNDDIAQANSSLSSFDQLQKEAMFINDRASISDKILSKRAEWSVIIQELINSVPADVQFVSINSDLSKTPNFTLQGSTTSEREAIKLRDKLENSQFFKDVNFKSSVINPSAADNKTQTLNFTLEFNIEKLSLGNTSKGGNK